MATGYSAGFEDGVQLLMRQSAVEGFVAGMNASAHRPLSQAGMNILRMINRAAPTNRPPAQNRAAEPMIKTPPPRAPQQPQRFGSLDYTRPARF